MRKPEKVQLAARVAEKINRGNRMLALAWVGSGYAVLTLEDWSAMLTNKRATYEDLVAIYSPPVTADQVLDDLRGR